MKFDQIAETDWKSGAEDILFSIRDVFKEKYPALADTCLDSLAENYGGEDPEIFIDALGQEISSLHLLLYEIDTDSDTYGFIVIAEEEQEDFKQSMKGNRKKVYLKHQSRQPLGNPARRINLAKRIKYETYTLPDGYDIDIFQLIPEHLRLSYDKKNAQGRIIERGAAFLPLKTWPPVLEADIHKRIYDLLKDEDGKYYGIVGNTILDERGYFCDHRDFIVSGYDFEHLNILHEENLHIDTPRGSWYYISWEIEAVYDNNLFVMREDKKEHTKTIYAVPVNQDFDSFKKELFCVEDEKRISCFKLGKKLYLIMGDDVYKWKENSTSENKFEKVYTVNGLSSSYDKIPLGESKIAFQVRPKNERVEDKIGELTIFDLSNGQTMRVVPCYFGPLNKLSENIVCVSKFYPTSKQPILEAVDITTGEKRVLKYGAIKDNEFTHIIRTDYGHILVSENTLFMVQNLWEQMEVVKVHK